MTWNKPIIKLYLLNIYYEKLTFFPFRIGVIYIKQLLGYNRHI